MAPSNSHSAPTRTPTTTPTTTPIDKNGTPWSTTNDTRLLALSQHLSISAIQLHHFRTFTTTQLSSILTHAKMRLHDSQVAKIRASDPNSDDDEVFGTGFALRRKGEPAWQGTTTPWEHRSKPGVGWLPVEERQYMMDFVKNSEREMKGDGK